jgi:hypothetical protein
MFDTAADHFERYEAMQLERLLLGSRAYLVTRRVGLGTFKITFKVPPRRVGSRYV